MLEQALIFFRKKPGIPASQNNFVSKKSQSTL